MRHSWRAQACGSLAMRATAQGRRSKHAMVSPAKRRWASEAIEPAHARPRVRQLGRNHDAGRADAKRKCSPSLRIGDSLTAPFAKISGQAACSATWLATPRSSSSQPAVFAVATTLQPRAVHTGAVGIPSLRARSPPLTTGWQARVRHARHAGLAGRARLPRTKASVRRRRRDEDQLGLPPARGPGTWVRHHQGVARLCDVRRETTGRVHGSLGWPRQARGAEDGEQRMREPGG